MMEATSSSETSFVRRATRQTALCSCVGF
jgi:hypothetical protein